MMEIILSFLFAGFVATGLDMLTAAAIMIVKLAIDFWRDE